MAESQQDAHDSNSPELQARVATPTQRLLPHPRDGERLCKPVGEHQDIGISGGGVPRGDHGTGSAGGTSRRAADSGKGRAAKLPPTSVVELCSYHKEGGLERLRTHGGIQALAKALSVNLEQGLKPEHVTFRRESFGANSIPEKPPLTYLHYFWHSLQDFTMQLLLICAVTSIVIAMVTKLRWDSLQEDDLGWLDGVAIIGTVLLVVNVEAVQNWSKDRLFRRLNADVQQAMVIVRRNGAKTRVVKYDLVVGDVVIIAVGDVLEADGILIQGSAIEVNEAALTGEADDIKKDPVNAPFLYSGTSVKEGSGTYLVTAVGINSQSGKITAMVRGQRILKDHAEEALVHGSISDPELGRRRKTKEEGNAHSEDEDSDDVENEGSSSVLKEKLGNMVGHIAYFAFASAGLATLFMLGRVILHSYVLEGNGWNWQRDPDVILAAIITGIAIVVVAVPEGLPLAVTFSLTLSMKKMMKDNNHVKHLDATETMGSATTICSDKTGTLTMNQMEVVRASIGDIESHCTSVSCGHTILQEGTVNAAVLERICENICINKAETAEITWCDNRWAQIGNKTDCALLAFAYDLQVGCTDLIKGIRAKREYQVVDMSGTCTFGLKTYPFSSDRKRSGQAVPLTLDPHGSCRLCVKGASEIVLRLSSQEARPDGSVVHMSEGRRKAILNDTVERWAMDQLRTIALAYRDFREPPDWDLEVDQLESLRLTGQTGRTFVAETGLTFLGIMGIKDPIRLGVPDAIGMCNSAGIDVIMVTGDHRETAVAVAKECGILRHGIDYMVSGGELFHTYTAMTGEQFRAKVLVKGKLCQEAFDEVWPYLRVLARSSPEDKHTLVSGLCESELYATPEGRQLPIYPDRQIVAVTGDGTNDAPALRRADVGFAMRIAGTRVAQEAADIILLDDNFESVVKACMWGRNVYDSIAKFLQFQLTVNVSAVFISVLGAVVVDDAPLTVVQMLWVNLIMDSLGALALASEKPTEELLKRKPYGRNRSLLSFEMKCNILFQSMYQLAVLIFLMFAAAGPWCRPDQKDLYTSCAGHLGGLLNIESGLGRDHGAPPTQHYTLIFNCFVLMQLGNWVNCRKLFHEYNVFEGVFSNPTFCGIWLGCLVVQVLAVQLAGFFGGTGTNKVFKTQALSSVQWAICVVCGVLSFIWQLCISFGGRQLKPYCCKASDLPPSEWRENRHTKLGPTTPSKSGEDKSRLYSGSDRPRDMNRDMMRCSMLTHEGGLKQLCGDESLGGDTGDEQPWPRRNHFGKTRGTPAARDNPCEKETVCDSFERPCICPKGQQVTILLQQQAPTLTPPLPTSPVDGDNFLAANSNQQGANTVRVPSDMLASVLQDAMHDQVCRGGAAPELATVGPDLPKVEEDRPHQHAAPAPEQVVDQPHQELVPACRRVCGDPESTVKFAGLEAVETDDDGAPVVMRTANPPPPVSHAYVVRDAGARNGLPANWVPASGPPANVIGQSAVRGVSGEAAFRVRARFGEAAKTLEMEVDWKQARGPTVVALKPGGESASRGVIAGDVLTELNSASILDWSREHVLPLMRQRPLMVQVERRLKADDVPEGRLKLDLEIVQCDHEDAGIELVPPCGAGLPPEVADVRACSPAWTAGVLPGDCLLRLDGHRVAAVLPQCVLQMLQARPSVRLTVGRPPLGYDSSEAALSRRFDNGLGAPEGPQDAAGPDRPSPMMNLPRGP